VGGGLSFSKVNVGYDFSVSPMGGYLLGEKIAVGLSTGYSHNKYSSRYGFSNSSFSVQPFFRYYITQNRLSAFAEVAYGLAWSKYNYVDYTYNIPMEQKNTKFTSKIGVGLDYFITNNVAIEGNLRYTSTDFPQGMLNFSVGLQVFIR
jgi:opacity protein-like surface antigen